MYFFSTKNLALVTALALSSTLLCAADKPADAAKKPAEASSKGTPIPEEVKPKGPTKRAVVDPSKLVDINHASRTELLKLPGLSSEEVDKIIAGRPYSTKTHLVLRNIVSDETFGGIQRLIVVK